MEKKGRNLSIKFNLYKKYTRKLDVDNRWELVKVIQSNLDCFSVFQRLQI